MSTELEPRRVCVVLGTVDASGPDERTVFVANDAVRICAVNIVDQAAKTGHTSNYGTYQIINKGTAGTGSTVVAERSTDTVTTDDMTAYVAWPVTLSTTKSYLEIGALEVLTFKATEAGTPGSGDLTDGLVVIEYADGTGGGI